MLSHVGPELLQYSPESADSLSGRVSGRIDPVVATLFHSNKQDDWQVYLQHWMLIISIILIKLHIEKYNYYIVTSLTII